MKSCLADAGFTAALARLICRTIAAAAKKASPPAIAIPVTVQKRKICAFAENANDFRVISS